MTGLHGFVSVNSKRYNIPMIAAYGVILALFLRMLIDRHPQAAKWVADFEKRFSVACFGDNCC